MVFFFQKMRWNEKSTIKIFFEIANVDKCLTEGIIHKMASCLRWRRDLNFTMELFAVRVEYIHRVS